MSLSLPKIIDRALVFLIAFLVFLIPIFFLPLTGGNHEFEKLALLVVSLVVGYSLLAAQLFLKKELRFVRTKFDLPILLLLGVYTASTIFSVSPAVSLLGQYGVFHGGLLSLFLYIALFCLVVNSQLTTDNLQLTILFSSFSLSLLSLLQYFEVYLFPWEFTHQRFWNPIGGIRILIVYLFVNLPLIFAWMVKTKGFKKLFPSLVLIFVLVSIFLISNFGGSLRNFLPEKYRTLPAEVTLDWQTSWQVANSVLAFRPLFGSGPGTFASDFTRFKPLDFNQKVYWNIRFNRPANEWLEIVATLGLLGIIVYLYFWVRIIKVMHKSGIMRIVTQKNAEDGFGVTPRNYLCLSASILFFLISTFFCPMTIVTAVLFWVLLAFFVTEAGLTEEVLVNTEAIITDFKGKKTTRPVPLFKIFFYCLVPVACFLSYFYFFRFFRAEIHYQRATFEFLQNRERAFNLALSATQLNPLSDVYQIGLATASLGVASPLSQQASPSGQLIQQFINQTIVAGNKAIQLNPENVRNWENLAGLYQNLLQTDPNAEQQFVNSFNQAINLDPMNPVLRNQLANFLLQRGKIEEAVDQLFVAIRLKPDYVQAHYDLAQAYKKVGDHKKALRELQIVLTLLPQDVPEVKTVELELQNLVSEEATPSGEYSP